MIIKAVVFDFDGLMIESERIALRIWKEVVAALGGEMDDEVNLLLIGKAPDAGAGIVRDLLELPITADELRQIYWERRTIEMCNEAEPVDGLQGLIEDLLARNIRLGVASNSPTTYVEQVLTAIQLRRPMECVVGSDQVKAGKPAPEIYLETARRLGVGPGAILALEDSPTGVTAAIQAGMTCYAVPNRDLLEEDFSGAHRVFKSMPALHEHLREVLPDGPRHV